MRKVVLCYNVSPDIVLRHHGVTPHRRRDRIDLMRPLAEEVLGRLRQAFPQFGLELRPKEWGDDRLMGLIPPPEGMTDSERDGVGDIVAAVNADYRLPLMVLPQDLLLMSPEALAVLKPLNGLGIDDTLTLMRVIDEVLVVVDHLVSLCRYDVMVRVDPSIRDFSGRCEFLPTADGETMAGLSVQFAMPSTLGVVLHEAAHIVSDPDPKNCVEVHGQPFVDGLEMLLPVFMADGGDGTVRSIISGETPPRLAEYGGRPDIIDGGRWRLVLEGDKAFGIWRPDSAARWGEGTTDTPWVLSKSNPRQRKLVLLCLGRHPSELRVGACDRCPR